MSKLHSDALKLDGKGYGYNRKAIVKRYFSYLMVITLLASSSYLQAATPTNKKQPPSQQLSNPLPMSKPMYNAIGSRMMDSFC